MTVLTDKLPPNNTLGGPPGGFDGSVGPMTQWWGPVRICGTELHLRFRAGTGPIESNVAWHIDDVQIGAPCPSPTPTPTPPPGSCPATMTQSSSQVIANNNSAVCGIDQTSYWRAFDLAPPSVGMITM